MKNLETRYSRELEYLFNKQKGLHNKYFKKTQVVFLNLFLEKWDESIQSKLN